MSKDIYYYTRDAGYERSAMIVCGGAYREHDPLITMLCACITETYTIYVRLAHPCRYLNLNEDEENRANLHMFRSDYNEDYLLTEDSQTKKRMLLDLLDSDTEPKRAYIKSICNTFGWMSVELIDGLCDMLEVNLWLELTKYAE